MMKCARHSSLLGRRQVSDDDHPSIGEEFRYEMARRLPSLLTEKKLDFGDCNKIFSTSWISEDLVIAGTKCNKVSVPYGFGGCGSETNHGSTLPFFFTHISYTLWISTARGSRRFHAWESLLRPQLLDRLVVFTVFAVAPTESG